MPRQLCLLCILSSVCTAQEFYFPSSDSLIASKSGNPLAGPVAHFPDGEVDWLERATNAQIGDIDKSDIERHDLEKSIEEWKRVARKEKALAFSEGFKKAVGEYRIYNTTRGQAIFKFVGIESLASEKRAYKRGHEKIAAELYNVPDSDHYFTSKDGVSWKGSSSHFPDAEVEWLGRAASGQIGDDMKTDEDAKALNDTISMWRDKAHTEREFASSEGYRKAVGEYRVYNTSLGKAIFKFVGMQTLQQIHPSRASGMAPQPVARQDEQDFQKLFEIASLPGDCVGPHCYPKPYAKPILNVGPLLSGPALSVAVASVAAEPAVVPLIQATAAAVSSTPPPSESAVVVAPVAPEDDPLAVGGVVVDGETGLVAPRGSARLLLEGAVVASAAWSLTGAAAPAAEEGEEDGGDAVNGTAESDSESDDEGGDTADPAPLPEYNRSFLLRAPGPGRYVLEISGPGLTTQSYPLEVPSG